MGNDYQNPEDLLIDSTFQKYCAGTDKHSKAYWEKWINENADKKELFDAAVKLYYILNGNKKPVDKQLILLESKLETPTPAKIIPLGSRHNILKIAVAAAAVIIGSLLFFRYQTFKSENDVTNRTAVYTANNGVKRKIVLEDGTQVFLNSASKLTVYKDFNKNDREVFLSGEAFFDVAHNKKKPFKVFTEKFNVKVLGTSFNIKTYKGDNTSEITLLRGAITMEDNRNPGSLITMRPSQKVIVYANVKKQEKKTNALRGSHLPSEIAINHYTLGSDSSVAEIAWSKNRIEISDQTFADIKPILERWYNVNIQFAPPGFSDYRFTATFNNESITDVLNALQKAHHFKYSLTKNNIIISK
ncbi:FecR family protein [Mucilaginibacter pineti]|uniref:FecR family protein n=1 Tax=Mucilaginibacter pineti TaxID=1391627 RepID=A0A1G7LN17_9SPHI|nr:FecR family protein [Mucilaginibacter pineti]SDF50781.1 FecR family protein [Mucilaginibacter pineti]